jgi:hypothetical protein
VEADSGPPFIDGEGKGMGAPKAVGRGRWPTTIDGGGARVGAAVSRGEGARRRRRHIEDAKWWEGKRRGSGEDAGERSACDAAMGR